MGDGRMRDGYKIIVSTTNRKKAIYSITVPAEIGDALRDINTLRFTVEVTDDGILYRAHRQDVPTQAAPPKWGA